HVHNIVATMQFPDKRKIEEYKEVLQSRIFNAVRRCGRSLFIFDELDKLPETLLDIIKPFLDYKENVAGVDFRQSIFIFLSNHGHDAIKNVAFEKIANVRETLKAADFEHHVIMEIYNSKGGLKHSELINKHLIDHFVPFLPLRRQEVKECARVYLSAYHTTAAEDDNLLEEIANNLIYIPVKPEIPVFSSSGCKRVEQKAGVALATWKAKRFAKSKRGEGNVHDEISEGFKVVYIPIEALFFSFSSLHSFFTFVVSVL
ncbi:hypothetical protein PMAYCL1PPCAC_13181, partial [Pristionchus mayeri]